MLEFKHKKMQKLKKVNMHNHLPNIQQGIQAWCSYQIYDPKSDYPRNYNVKKTKPKKKDHKITIMLCESKTKTIRLHLT